MNNFELWKQQLTLEKLLRLLNFSCFWCPLRAKCESVQFRLSKSCADLLTEWSEQESEDEDYSERKNDMHEHLCEKLQEVNQDSPRYEIKVTPRFHNRKERQQMALLITDRIDNPWISLAIYVEYCPFCGVAFEGGEEK